MRTLLIVFVVVFLSACESSVEKDKVNVPTRQLLSEISQSELDPVNLELVNHVIRREKILRRLSADEVLKKIESESFRGVYICAFGKSVMEFYIDRQKADFLAEVDRNNEAISFMLPHMFDRIYGENSDASYFVAGLLKKTHTKEAIARELQNALESLKVKTEKTPYGEFSSFHMMFFGHVIRLQEPHYKFDAESQFDNTKMDVAVIKLKKEIQSSVLYSVLKKS